MQKAITLTYQGQTLRGMEHRPSATGDPMPAVVLFHGFTANKLQPHRMFLKICRALENLNIASFRYDFLGSGESDGNLEDVTLSQEIAEANAILDQVRTDPRIDPKRISLIGLSLGGVVASLVAAKRPEDIQQLVLIAPAANILDVVFQYVSSMGLDVQASLKRLSQAEPFDLKGDLIGRAFAFDLQQFDFFADARGYVGDVMLVHGTRDLTVPYQVSLNYNEKTYDSRATVHLVEDADHTFDKSSWETALIGHLTQFLSQTT